MPNSGYFAALRYFQYGLTSLCSERFIKYLVLDNDQHFMQINQSDNMDHVARYCKSMACFPFVIEYFWQPVSINGPILRDNFSVVVPAWHRRVIHFHCGYSDSVSTRHLNVSPLTLMWHNHQTKHARTAQQSTSEGIKTRTGHWNQQDRGIDLCSYFAMITVILVAVHVLHY